MSLLATYQNKYTFHRAIAAAAALLCWLTSISIVGAILTRLAGRGEAPNWFVLPGLFLFSLAVVAGFSATFRYYWQLWGDTLVTDTFCGLFGPEVKDHGFQQQPAGD